MLLLHLEPSRPNLTYLLLRIESCCRPPSVENNNRHRAAVEHWQQRLPAENHLQLSHGTVSVADFAGQRPDNASRGACHCSTIHEHDAVIRASRAIAYWQAAVRCGDDRSANGCRGNGDSHWRWRLSAG